MALQSGDQLVAIEHARLLGWGIYGGSDRVTCRDTTDDSYKRPCGTSGPRHARRMPRKTADERHRIDPDASTELMDMLIAVHHPTRQVARRAAVDGGARDGWSVGGSDGPRRVAASSYHLKPLHQAGVHRPAPDSPATPGGPGGGSPRATTAGRSTTSSRTASVARSPRRRRSRASATTCARRSSGSRRWRDSTVEWRRAAGSSDSLVKATAAQTADLHRRLDAVVAEWTRECQQDEQGVPTRIAVTVRTILRLFPSKPVRP